MKSTKTKSRFFLLSAGFLCVPGLLPAEDGASLTREQMEQFLLNAQPGQSRELGEGVTASRRITLSDGQLTHDGHWQTIDEHKANFEGTMGHELNFSDSYKHNIAGYLLDKIMGLNMIPVSVQRKLTGKTGALTWWVDNVQMTERQRMDKKMEPPDVHSWNLQMHIVRIFDQLIYNTDRNLGNLLITKDWRIWMIDHTRAFRFNKDLKDPKNLRMCDRRLFAALKALNKETLNAQLKPYLDGMQIGGLLARRDRIVKTFEKMAAEQGDAAVFYDYLPPN